MDLPYWGAPRRCRRPRRPLGALATLAILVLGLAFGRDRDRTDSNGALRAIAAEPFGRLLLVLLAIGFAAYALWRLIEAVTPHPDREHDILIRLADAGRVVLYTVLCGLTIATLFGSKRTRGHAEQGWTARVLSWRGGRFWWPASASLSSSVRS